MAVLAGVATMSSGPGTASEQTLRTLNFNDDVGSEGRPATRRLFDLFVQGDVGVTRYIALGVHASRARNYTTGRLAHPSDPRLNSDVTADHRVMTTAFVASVRPTNWLTVGVGPALYKVGVTLRGAARSDVRPLNETLAGSLFSSTLVFRRQDPYFGALVVQYRGIGSVDTPLSVIPTTGPPGTVTWPASSVRFSHWFLGVGGGIGF